MKPATQTHCHTFPIKFIQTFTDLNDFHSFGFKSARIHRKEVTEQIEAWDQNLFLERSNHILLCGDHPSYWINQHTIYSNILKIYTKCCILNSQFTKRLRHILIHSLVLQFFRQCNQLISLWILVIILVMVVILSDCELGSYTVSALTLTAKKCHLQLFFHESLTALSSLRSFSSLQHTETKTPCFMLRVSNKYDPLSCFQIGACFN